AEAERERRARIITADGEYQASKRLAAAANVMARDPAALQLRLLQTVVEVASERNSTLVMPVPVELLRFFEKMAPAGPAPAPAPPPADTGDAEVAEPEPEIGAPLRAQIPGTPRGASARRPSSSPSRSRRRKSSPPTPLPPPRPPTPLPPPRPPTPLPPPRTAHGARPGKRGTPDRAPVGFPAAGVTAPAGRA